MKYQPLTPDEDPCNRGVTGQPLGDTQQPGDPATGKPTNDNNVNMDPRSRDDEGY